MLRLWNRLKGLRDKRVEANDGIDWKAYRFCENSGGHLGVHSIDSWFCLRCWVGFFMGLAFGITEEEKYAIVNGTARKLALIEEKLYIHTVWAPGLRGVESTLEAGGEVYLVEGAELIAYSEAIKMAPDVKPCKDGGPPHVYELREVRR